MSQVEPPNRVVGFITPAPSGGAAIEFEGSEEALELLTRVVKDKVLIQIGKAPLSLLFSTATPAITPDIKED